MITPTFLIAGAPRSGTSFLYQLLDSHPEIFMAKPLRPEPKFFLVDEEYAKGLTYYSFTYFRSAGGYRAIGEKSTNYMENPQVADRIVRDLPDVKLVFILRNPVDRAFSNYLWSKKSNIEHLTFEEALGREEHREQSYEPRFRYARPYSYLSRGLYKNHLLPFFEHFGRDQIKVMLFEELFANPQREVAELLTFLRVSSEIPAIDFRNRVNAAHIPGEDMTADTRALLSQFFYHSNLELAQLLGRSLDLWHEPERMTG